MYEGGAINLIPQLTYTRGGNPDYTNILLCVGSNKGEHGTNVLLPKHALLIRFHSHTNDADAHTTLTNTWREREVLTGYNTLPPQ